MNQPPLSSNTEPRVTVVPKGEVPIINLVAPVGSSYAISSAFRNDNTLRLWDLLGGRFVRDIAALPQPKRQSVIMKMSPTSKWIGLGSEDGNVRLYEARMESHSSKFTFRSSSPSNPRLNLTERETFFVNGEGIDCLAFSPDEKTLAIGATNRTLSLWHIPDGNKLRNLDAHVAEVSCIGFSPDGKLVAAGNGYGDLRVFDTASGKQLRAICYKHKRKVWDVCFSPEGTLFASSDDSAVHLWDGRSDNPIFTLHGHSDYICALAFSTNGQMVASASGDKTIRLWDTASGECLATLTDHLDAVRNVRFFTHPGDNSQLLCSSSFDGTVRVWEVQSTNNVATFAAFGSSWAAVRSDGRCRFHGKIEDFTWHVPEGFANSPRTYLENFCLPDDDAFISIEYLARLRCQSKDTPAACYESLVIQPHALNHLTESASVYHGLTDTVASETKHLIDQFIAERDAIPVNSNNDSDNHMCYKISEKLILHGYTPAVRWLMDILRKNYLSNAGNILAMTDLSQVELDVLAELQNLESIHYCSETGIPTKRLCTGVAKNAAKAVAARQ